MGNCGLVIFIYFSEYVRNGGAAITAADFTYPGAPVATVSSLNRITTSGVGTKEAVLILSENVDVNNTGVTKRVIIETGKTQEDNIEVLSGLNLNMEIVEEGARSVKEGQNVEIINQ